MAALIDLKTDFENYLQDYVTIRITNLWVQNGTTPIIEVGEIWKFKVEVENNGHMGMKKVVLKIQSVSKNGQRLTWVTPTIFPVPNFQDYFISSEFTVPAQNTSLQPSGYFYFYAIAPAHPATEIVIASISSFDLDWDHMLESHSNGASIPNSPLIREIF